MERQKKQKFSFYGQKLQDARLAKKHSQKYIASQMKLSVSQIEAMENGQISAWKGAYNIGYVQSYANLLEVKLPKDLFSSSSPSKSMATLKPISDRSFILSTLSLSVALVIGVVSVLLYVMWQVFILTSPPSLVIQKPDTNFITDKTQVKIAGKTSENTDISINGVSVLTEPDGGFSVDIPLQPGLNDLSITATNRLTKKNTKKITIIADYQIDPIASITQQ